MERELIQPIEYLKFDKISDDVYAIGPNFILRFNVSLSKTVNDKRYHFHKEYEYSTKRGSESLVTLKRSFDYYLSIENIQKDSNGNKLFIRIGPQEQMIFKKGLEEAISWFTDKKYSKLYAKDKGNLIMLAPIPEFRINNLPMQKYILLTPTIIDKGIANADKEPGIRMEFGDNCIVEISIDRMMGLYYIISCFNMYQSAITLINYIGRPEFGTNRIVMENQKTFSNSEYISGGTGIEGRFVTPVGIKNNMESLEG